MKKMYIISGVIILAILIIAVIFMFNPFKKKNEVTETRDFSLSNLAGFKYPVFKGWDVQVKNGGTPISPSAEIIYSPSPDASFDAYVPYKITIQEIMMEVAGGFWEKQPINPKGVTYIARSSKDSYGNTALIFRIGINSFEISIPKNTNENGFSGQKVWDTILDSFFINYPN